MRCKKFVPLLLSALLLWAMPAAATEPVDEKDSAETTEATPAPQNPSVLKIALSDPEASEMGVVGNAFKKYVEEKTQGKVRVECTYGSTLGDDEGERYRRVQKGTLDMTLGGIANLTPLEKRLGILTLPYLFNDLNEVIVGTNGQPAELLNTYAIEAGLRVLTWTYSGYRNVSNSKHPITTLADMKGLTIRVPQSAIMIDTYKAFGAIPSVLPWSSVFNALKQGELDGQCYGYIGFKAMNFLDANQKYMTELRYSYYLQPLVISERVFAKFDRETQKILVAAGKHAQEEVLKFQIEQASVAKRELIAAGLIVSELTDEDAWRKIAYDKVWPKAVESTGGPDIINAYLKACGKAPRGWSN